ncbi:MAG: hypothetical protein ABSE49_19900 [Polyangiaceae bacterium]
MRYRTLTAAPLVLVALALAGWGLAPVDARPSVLAAAVESAKVLSILGCVVAAWTFEPGDYLRRAWLLLALCTLLLLGRDAVALAGGSALAQGVLATAGNGCSVAGTWILARAWAVSGLDPDDAPIPKWPLRAAAAAVALAVTGWPLVGDVVALARGDAFAVVPLASDVADTVVLALLAPLLRTTLALQGGVLRWPWALMTAGNLLWLVFDALYGVLGLLHVDPSRTRVATEMLRVVATMCLFSAGLAQRRAVQAAAT